MHVRVIQLVSLFPNNRFSTCTSQLTWYHKVPTICSMESLGVSVLRLLFLLLLWTRIEPANSLVGHLSRHDHSSSHNHNNHHPPQHVFRLYGTTNVNGDRDSNPNQNHGGMVPHVHVHVNMQVQVQDVAVALPGMDDAIRANSTTPVFDCVAHPLGEEPHHEQSHRHPPPQPALQPASAPFERDKQWLEKATARFLTQQQDGFDVDHHGQQQQLQQQQLQQQLSSLPLLTIEDVHEIKGLMTAWARRGSPLVVESLLKRIIDDMRAGNTEIHVSTRFYAIVSKNMKASNAYTNEYNRTHTHTPTHLFHRSSLSTPLFFSSQSGLCIWLWRGVRVSCKVFV